jgi:V8-like Glu-specific endopeptidase
MVQKEEHHPASNKNYHIDNLSESMVTEVVGKLPRPSIINKASTLFRRLTLTSRVNSRPSVPLDENLPHIDTIKPVEEIACGDNPRNEVNAKSYPYRMICLLVITDFSGEKFRGTGFFISPRCIVTAGHCVFPQGHWAKEIEVVPGVKGTETPPFGSQKSSWFETTNGWIENKREENDYGVVLLPNDELHTRIDRCHFGYKIIADNQQQLQLTVSGYPEDKASVQWRGIGPVSEIKPNKLTYKIDTEKGNSGSPVFLGIDDIYYALGIHNYGQCPNFCTRITKPVVDNFNRWISISMNPPNI